MEGLSLKDAQKILLEEVEIIEENEEISLWDAVGRVLSEDLVAKKNQPPFSRSPLDGYAVQSEDIKSATTECPAVLLVIDEATAGRVCGKEVLTGTAVRIMTGAPIPKGADCIVKQEDTNYGEDMVEIYQPVKPYQNYCFEGEDYKAGTTLLSKGVQLGAVEIGTIASLGCEKVQVHRRPKVALLTTGDEILLPGEELTVGKIYDSNLYTLGSRLISWNMDVILREHVGDEAGIVAAKIKEVVKPADIILTTGGVSVGKKDIMHDVLKILDCKHLFWKIAIKPGMPTLCAQYEGKLLICMSGNPFGAVATMELLVRPILAKMTEKKELMPERIQAVTENAFLKKSPMTRYVRAYYQDGHVHMSDGSNSSGVLSSMCGCNCLVEIPAGTECVIEGDMVWAVML